MAIERAMRARYKQLAERAGRELDGADAREILGWAFEEFGEKLCVASSMGDAVVLSLACAVRPGVDVIFLQTGYHFAETNQTADEVERRYPVRLHRMLPKQTIAEQDALFGEKLHDRDPDACCGLRKVEPLRRGLEPFHAWATGLRREETESRRNTPVVEWDENRAMVKVNPIAAWSQAELDAYITVNEVVVNPLLAQGYPSIGCAPCTRRVAADEDPRAGRWAGAGKTECGLHFGADGKLGPVTPLRPRA